MPRGAEDLQPTDVAISEATADAIHAAGKQDFVSNMLGRGRSTLMGWASADVGEFIPLRLVPALEKLGRGSDGWPHITRALARFQGFELFRLPVVDGAAGDWLRQISAVSTETAEITAKICASLADDQAVCADDVRRHGLIGDAEQLLALSVQMLAHLRATARD